MKKFQNYGAANFSIAERTTVDKNVRDGWNNYIINTNKNFFDQNKLYLKSMQEYMTLELPGSRKRSKEASGGPKIRFQHNRRQKKQADVNMQDVPRMAAKIDSVSSLSRSESMEKLDKKKKPALGAGNASLNPALAASAVSNELNNAIPEEYSGGINSKSTKGRRSSVAFAP